MAAASLLFSSETGQNIEWSGHGVGQRERERERERDRKKGKRGLRGTGRSWTHKEQGEGRRTKRTRDGEETAGQTGEFSRENSSR